MHSSNFYLLYRLSASTKGSIVLKRNNENDLKKLLNVFSSLFFKFNNDFSKILIRLVNIELIEFKILMEIYFK